MNFDPINPDKGIGKNDLQKAKAAQYSYFIAHNRLENIDEDAYLGFEENLHEAVEEWS